MIRRCQQQPNRIPVPTLGDAASVIGFSGTTMRELAERHLAVWKRVDAYATERE